MSPALILILVVSGAYLAAHVAFEWLARRFVIISGGEYLLLGILLGPQVSGLIGADAVGGFAPFMTLALGWIGAVIGVQFYVPGLVRVPGIFYRIALLESILSLAVVAGLMAWLLSWIAGQPVAVVLPAAVVLGAVAVATAPSGIALVVHRLGRRGPLVRQLEVTTALNALVAIVSFGLLLSLSRGLPAEAAAGRAPTPTEWVVISLAVGVVGGLLFHLFLGGERKSDRLFIALAGALILASGASAYLRLTPLLAALLIGVILVNTSPNRDEIRQVLIRVERPLYFVLLIFAGAAWRPIPWIWVTVVVAFVLARTLAKVGGARLAARLTGTIPVLGLHWGRALLGHGGLALAIGLNYQILDGGLLANVVFTATIVSVLLTDLYSARLAHSVLEPSRGGIAAPAAGGAGAPPVGSRPPRHQPEAR
jgi:hypothetical protein